MTDWTGNGATLRTETLAIPVLPGLRCSPPARHAAIRQILLFHPAGIPDPASSQPARQAPGSQTAATPPPPRTGKHPRKPVTQRGRPGSPTDHPPSHLLCRDPASGPDPDERARIRGVLRAPSHLDGATVTYLTQGLYGQRHAEDSLGPSIMLAPMSAQLETLKILLRQTSGPNKPALMHLVANWTTFIGWLQTSLRDYPAADIIFAEAEEMSDELGDGILASTATSYRGYVANAMGFGCLTGCG